VAPSIESAAFGKAWKTFKVAEAGLTRAARTSPTPITATNNPLSDALICGSSQNVDKRKGFDMSGRAKCR
jgi:hypothetical protein